MLVAAPTGAGKTLVAEFAIHLAMQQARDKVFYTAPMKALSNQKFQELVAEYGASEVGLLTGDTNVNSRARIVVMTTEVLRNMIYAGSEMLDDLRYVVLDEVHHAGDGLSWGEAVAHAFDGAKRRVCLTGTPFRTRPDERIPFVRYEPDGTGGLVSTADYSYGYADALRDHVVARS